MIPQWLNQPLCSGTYMGELISSRCLSARLSSTVTWSSKLCNMLLHFCCLGKFEALLPSQFQRLVLILVHDQVNQIVFIDISLIINLALHKGFWQIPPMVCLCIPGHHAHPHLPAHLLTVDHLLACFWAVGGSLVKFMNALSIVCKKFVSYKCFFYGWCCWAPEDEIFCIEYSVRVFCIDLDFCLTTDSLIVGLKMSLESGFDLDFLAENKSWKCNYCCLAK